MTAFLHTDPTSKKSSRHMRAGVASAASGLAGWAAGFGLGWPAVIIAAATFVAAVATLMWILNDGKRSLRLVQLICAIRTGKVNSSDPSSFGIEPSGQPLKELPRPRRGGARQARSNAARPAHSNSAQAKDGERLAGEAATRLQARS